MLLYSDKLIIQTLTWEKALKLERLALVMTRFKLPAVLRQTSKRISLCPDVIASTKWLDLGSV